MVIKKTDNLISYQTHASGCLASPVIFSEWTDYKWQLKNSIKTISAFEKFTGITFTKKAHKNLEKTIQKFPLSITPYYASLIEK